MMTFALKGSREPQVHAAHSRTRLQIRGCFHITGPQIVGGDGGAPQWVADVLAAHPEIEEIAVNRGSGGVCYARMPANRVLSVNGVVDKSTKGHS
jgi:hypothetical protein